MTLGCPQVNSHEVLQVTRRGGQAVHFLPVPLDPGSEVDLRVDWTRRWDHMQQHSGRGTMSIRLRRVPPYWIFVWLQVVYTGVDTGFRKGGGGGVRVTVKY